MKVLDVDLLQTGIKNNVDMLSRLEEEMKVIETSITGLVELDHSLTGEGERLSDHFTTIAISLSINTF